MTRSGRRAEFRRALHGFARIRFKGVLSLRCNAGVGVFFDLALWVLSHITLTALVGVWHSSEGVTAYGTSITELAFNHGVGVGVGAG